MLEKIFGLSGQTALVTGAARGLGEAMAKALAKAGAEVAVTDLTKESTDRVVREIRDLGRRAEGFGLDVSSKESVTKAVAEILNRFGRIDILVNNAGVNRRVPALELTEADWDLILDTNLKGVLLVCQAVVPQMIARGYGKVINMSSIMGQISTLSNVAYSSSKGGVNLMTKGMALEWAKLGVRVNAIGPTYFATPLTEPLVNDPVRSQYVKDHTPMGRFGQPEDLEGVVIFLASPASDFMTGQTVYVDGGWTAW